MSPNLQNPAPEGRILAPGTEKVLVFFGVVDDFSPGLEGRVGDQFGHPQGAQVKSFKFTFSFPSPPMDQ